MSHMGWKTDAMHQQWFSCIYCRCTCGQTQLICKWFCVCVCVCVSTWVNWLISTATLLMPHTPHGFTLGLVNAIISKHTLIHTPPPPCTHTLTNICKHVHTVYIHTHIYLHICVCVCVHMCWRIWIFRGAVDWLTFEDNGFTKVLKLTLDTFSKSLWRATVTT